MPVSAAPNTVAMTWMLPNTASVAARPAITPLRMTSRPRPTDRKVPNTLQNRTKTAMAVADVISEISYRALRAPSSA